MSADVLREAAALMRKRAETADGSVWQISGGTCNVTRPRENGRPFFVASTYGGLGAEEANAAHIASWHPLVALAVADWLEAEVPNAEYREKQRDHSNEFRLRAEPFVAYYDPTTVQAINVARAYLGGVR